MRGHIAYIVMALLVIVVALSSMGHASSEPCGGPDSDSDGWTDCQEAFIGTDPLDDCANTSTPDAWPPDFDDDTEVNGSDLFLLSQRLGTEEGVPPPAGKLPYSQRFDIFPTDASLYKIDGSDLFALGSYFGLTCAREDGQIRFFKKMGPSLDPFALNPAWQPTINERYEGGLAFPPLSDQFSWYTGEGFFYLDAYAIYVSYGSNPAGAGMQHVLRDGNGNPCYIPWGSPFPQYAADLGDPQFRSLMTSYVVSKLNSFPHYDGVYLDDVNLDISRVACGSDTAPRCDIDTGTNCPIDPRTSQLMTNEDWIRYVVEFTEQVQTAAPNHLTAHNTIWYIRDFTDPLLLRQIQAADYVEMEQGFVDGGLTNGSGKYSWSRKMDFVDLVRANGAEVINFDVQLNTVALQKYGLANYLLHSTSESYYGALWESNPDDDWSVWGANIGYAVGPRYQWNGLWRRDFAGGFTLVHPPGGSPVTVDLGATFTDLWGESMSDITLAQREGTVFRGS